MTNTSITYSPNYTIFDLETTGMGKDERIVEISAIRVRDSRMVASFSTLVNPMQHIPIAASQVNHITDDMVADAPTIKVALKAFMDFVNDDILVGHNIDAFDMHFINSARTQYIDGNIFTNVTIDSVKIARAKMPMLASRSLENLSCYFNVSYQGAHRALQDCGITYHVYERLMKSKLPEELSVGKQCPVCGSSMKLRHGKYGWFWSCTSYPSCKGTSTFKA